MKKFLLLLSLILFSSCQESTKKPDEIIKAGKPIKIDYAEGFAITEFNDYKIITVKNLFPNSEKTFTYLLSEKDAKIPENLEYDQKIQIPVEEIVVTSTTHIPSLETLQEEQSLVGFPSLNYISSEKTRALIEKGKVREIGKNEAINTEVLLALQPDVVVGFAVDGNNKTFQTIMKSGIPVVYNADWTEGSPLGKAEWIKFFGAFYNKLPEAEAAFNKVKEEYLKATQLAATAANTPTVLSGSMYKDVWYLPQGNSWQGQLIKDANGDYLYAETKGNGSLSLAFEQVLVKAKNADVWVGPAQFTSYEEMLNASEHYAEFDAFQNKNVYTFSSKKGATGGVIYYELAPNRPDLVLKDLISIFHPQLLPEHELVFFEPLK